MIFLTSVYNKVIVKKDRRLIANLLLLDLLSIFNRDLPCEDNHNSIVYIWCKNNRKITNLGGEITIRGTPIYVGFSADGCWEKIANSRAFMHKGDLLDKIIEDGYKCYCVCGLSEKEAHWLEAHWIDALNLPLTERGCYEYKAGTLINKKRESKPDVKTYPEDKWK